MKFVHLADVHLGAEPEGQTALGELRRQELWDAFEDVIDRCERERTDLLLLAGDLFDGQPLLCEVQRAVALFCRLTHTKVVMIAGNHDCLLPSSHYYDVAFPDHVFFLMDCHADSVYLPELNTQVYGLSYEREQIAEPRYDAITVEDRSRINILLAHGNLRGTDSSIPLHREVIEAQGFDYAALGHIHTRFPISDRIAYTGGFEPLERKESGEKGYIRGTLQKRGTAPAQIAAEFVPHAKRQYVPLVMEVTPEMTEPAVAERIAAEQRRIGLQHMYCVRLTGRRARGLTFSAAGLTRVGYVVEVTDETAPEADIERLKEQSAGTVNKGLPEEAQEEADGSGVCDFGRY